MPTSPSNPDSSRRIGRTLRRILIETAMVALAGLLVLGVAWELGAPRVGWILAAIIWIVGDPILEIAGAMGSDDRAK